MSPNRTSRTIARDGSAGDAEEFVRARCREWRSARRGRSCCCCHPRIRSRRWPRRPSRWSSHASWWESPSASASRSSAPSRCARRVSRYGGTRPDRNSAGAALTAISAGGASPPRDVDAAVLVSPTVPLLKLTGTYACVLAGVGVATLVGNGTSVLSESVKRGPIAISPATTHAGQRTRGNPRPVHRSVSLIYLAPARHRP